MILSEVETLLALVFLLLINAVSGSSTPRIKSCAYNGTMHPSGDEIFFCRMQKPYCCNYCECKCTEGTIHWTWCTMMMCFDDDPCLAWQLEDDRRTGFMVASKGPFATAFSFLQLASKQAGLMMHSSMKQEQGPTTMEGGPTTEAVGPSNDKTTLPPEVSNEAANQGISVALCTAPLLMVLVARQLGNGV